jgi:hypothetical protein
MQWHRQLMYSIKKPHSSQKTGKALCTKTSLKIKKNMMHGHKCSEPVLFRSISFGMNGPLMAHQG